MAEAVPLVAGGLHLDGVGNYNVEETRRGGGKLSAARMPSNGAGDMFL
jgi:hypothetical protein